jgi:hypothetical protein
MGDFKMRLVIKFIDENYVNIKAEILDVDKVNSFLYAYTKDNLVGAFKLEYIKDAHLSEKGGGENAL